MKDLREESAKSENGEKVTENSDVKPVKHQTSYFEALIHLFKAGLGPGCFAMGEAIGNTGIVLGVCLTIFLSIICLYEQHVLLKCANNVRRHCNLEKRPDYAMTFELSLQSNEKWKQHSVLMRRIVNTCLILTGILRCIRVVYRQQREKRADLFRLRVQSSSSDNVRATANNSSSADNQSQISR